MKRIFLSLVLVLVLTGVANGWEFVERIVYIDTDTLDDRVNIGNWRFRHSVLLKKVGSKSVWYMVAKKGDPKIQKALEYIEGHPELDIQWWKDYKEMYQDTEGIGREALERLSMITYDFDGDPETPDETYSVYYVINTLGYTWQQVLANKDKVVLPIRMLSMDME